MPPLRQLRGRTGGGAPRWWQTLALGRIAAALNEKGLAAPYDDPSHTKPAGRGWSAVQVHTMLRNERYTGRVVWNKREWVKDPVTKKRRPRLRPESEWVVKEDPELRIVPQDLWEAAQARHRTNGPRGGGVVNGKKKVRLLSGMLRCGICGSAMSIVGARGEWANYGCSAHHSKGDAICANGRLISERRVTEQVMTGLSEFVQSPQFQDYVEQSTAAADRAKRKTLGGDVQRLQAAVEAQAARAMRAGERFMESDGSQAMKAILQREEAKLRALQQQLSEASPREPKQAPPDYHKAGKAIEDILALVAVNPEGARVRLARFLSPVVLNPETDEATGKVDYAFDISLKNDSAALLAGGRVMPSVVDGLGCGGRI